MREKNIIDYSNAKQCGYYIFGAIIAYIAFERFAQIVFGVSINIVGVLVTKGFDFAELIKVFRPGLFAATVVPNAVQNFMSQLFAVGLVLLLSFRLLGLNFSVFFVKEEKSKLDRIFSVFFVAGVSMLGNVLGKLIEKGLNLNVQHIEMPKDSALAAIFFAVTVLLITPIFEELLFRGIILRLLRPYGAVAAVFITSLVFAFRHIIFAQTLQALFFSIAVSYLVYKFNDLSTAIYAHIFVNLFSFAATLLLRGLPENIYNVVAIAGYIVMGILSVGSGIILFKRSKTRKVPKVRLVFDAKTARDMLLNPVAIAFYAIVIFDWVMVFAK